MTTTETIAFCTLGLNVLLAGVGMLMAYAKLPVWIAKEIAKHKDEVRDKIALVESNFGEAIKGPQEHVRLLEIWCRDNLVRRDSFKDVVTELRNDNREWRNHINDTLKEIKALVAAKD